MKRLGGITGKGFMPGRSGNPGGRPRKRPISERYAEIAEIQLPETTRRKLGLKKGATWGDGIALGVALAAAKGNPVAAKEIREAIEGKSMQRVELTAETGGTVNVRLSLEQTVAKIREFYGLSTSYNSLPEIENRDEPEN